MPTKETESEKEEKDFNKLIDQLKEKIPSCWSEAERNTYRITKLQYIRAGWKSNQSDGTMVFVLLFGVIMTVFLWYINDKLASILTK